MASRITITPQLSKMIAASIARLRTIWRSTTKLIGEQLSPAARRCRGCIQPSSRTSVQGQPQHLRTRGLSHWYPSLSKLFRAPHLMPSRYNAQRFQPARYRGFRSDQRLIPTLYPRRRNLKRGATGDAIADTVIDAHAPSAATGITAIAAARLSIQYPSSVTISSIPKRQRPCPPAHAEPVQTITYPDQCQDTPATFAPCAGIHHPPRHRRDSYGCTQACITHDADLMGSSGDRLSPFLVQSQLTDHPTLVASASRLRQSANAGSLSQAWLRATVSGVTNQPPRASLSLQACFSHFHRADRDSPLLNTSSSVTR